MMQTGFVGLKMKVFLFYFLLQFLCYKVPFTNCFLLLIYNRLVVCSFSELVVVVERVVLSK